MQSITKKRLQAYLIDAAISTVVTAGLEFCLHKKVKNEVIRAVVSPTVATWALEFIQMRRSGQTIGYSLMGLILEGEQSSNLTGAQIMKRIVYRDAISSIHYLSNRQAFEKAGGAVLPHDCYAGTVVRQVQ